jgi:hypothetical protein
MNEMIPIYDRVIIFSSVWFLSKKIIKQNFFKKKRNRFKPTSFGSVRFFRFQTYKTKT